MNVEREFTVSARVRLATVIFAGSVASATAQGPPEQPPAPVRFTVAQSDTIRSTVTLPGTVEAVKRSIVASEVAGLVEQLNVSDGDEVEAGAVLVRLRRRPLQLQLDASRAGRREAQAQLERAERRLSRAIELYDDDVATLSQLDDTKTDRDGLISRIARLDATIAYDEDRLARSTIRAPFGGVVVRRFTETGQWMQSGGAVVELLSIDDLEVRAAAPERYFGELAPGQAASLRFGSMPEHDVRATVRAVIQSADASTRTFPVLVRLEGAGAGLGVGMLAKVGLALGAPREATLVPKDAVVAQGASRVVFIMGEDDAVRAVPVEVGLGAGDWVAVTGKVAPGMRVVTRGNERLRPGQTVSGELLPYAFAPAAAKSANE